MLSVSDGITDHVLKEDLCANDSKVSDEGCVDSTNDETYLEDTTGLFVDKPRDTLDTTTTSETTNGLCIALKMIIGQ